MIHQSVIDKQVSSELRKRFIAKAHEIAEAGAAGYGELAGTHFSYSLAIALLPFPRSTNRSK